MADLSALPSAEPVPSVVKLAEQLLAEAKSGEIRSIFYGYRRPGGDIVTGRAGAGSIPETLYALECVKWQLMAER